MTTDLLPLLARCLDEVRRGLGLPCDEAVESSTLLSGELDSMALVEFVAVVAEACGVRPDVIELAAAHRFGTLGELAEAMDAAGLSPRPTPSVAVAVEPGPDGSPCWLSSPVLRLPTTVQPAELLDERLARPAGWLARRAGIHQRHVWADEDPVGAAAEAARSSLSRAGLLPEEVGALLVASAAPPLLAGLAAAVHTRAGLAPRTPAIEVGGACAGFLSALWLAGSLAKQAGTVLIVCLEAPSQLWQSDDPAAVLFGDAAAACLVHDAPPTGPSLPLVDIGLEIDPAGADLLRVQRSSKGRVCLRMKGRRLAGSAVEAMAAAVEGVVQAQRWDLNRLAGVALHGGNGRLPRLVARRLGLSEDRVWSRTATTGNLGSASLLAAWADHEDKTGPVAWAAVGPGLTCAWALTGPTLRRPPLDI